MSPRDDSSSEDEFEDASETLQQQTTQHDALAVPKNAHIRLSDLDTSESQLRADLVDSKQSLTYFCNSRIREAKEACFVKAEKSLYHSLGYSMICAIQSLMSFQSEEMAAAIECLKSTMHLASLMRKPLGTTQAVSRWIKGSSSHHTISSMTLVERHAELVHAEALLLKAIVGIIYSGDFLAFLREALNLRSAYATYKSLGRYVQLAKDQGDPVDDDFESGVCLGTGLISLMLSLLPAKAINVMSLFGYSGDREEGLDTLMLPGHWSTMPNGLPQEKEGLRRPFNDGFLLVYHLVISAILPVGHVDIPLATRILDHMLSNYPQGSFWLWFSGRLHAVRTEGEQALVDYQRSVDAEKDYVQLHHICYWDAALTCVALGDYPKANEHFHRLRESSNWSKALYSYSEGVTLYELATQVNPPDAAGLKRAVDLLQPIPGLMQRIAGKSLPIEKFVARKSKKFTSQGHRLTLPTLELAMVLGVFGQAPAFKLRDVHLIHVDSSIKHLESLSASQRDEQEGYWDDYALAQLLRGMCLRYMAFPEPAAIVRTEGNMPAQSELVKSSMQSFEKVFQAGPQITLDHHIIWFAHYECGHLYDLMGELDVARSHYNKIMTRKGMEVHQKHKGKASMENAVVLKASAALDLLNARQGAQKNGRH